MQDLVPRVPEHVAQLRALALDGRLTVVAAALALLGTREALGAGHAA